MDSLTHIASGALIGELFAGKRIGPKAMIVGAIAQSLPDIDFAASFWLSPADDLLAHRGITHSLLFLVAASVVVGFTAHKTHRGAPLPAAAWMLFIAAELGMHLFLDAFNNYGTGWLEPFSNQRFSFNTVFVADPFFSLPLIVCFAVVVLLRRRIAAKKWAAAGLVISSLYLAYAVVNKLMINAAVARVIAAQKIPAVRYFTTPTAFNNWLWYIVIQGKDGFQTGYRSVFDAKDSVAFEFFPQQRSLVPAENTDAKKLMRFAQGYFTIEQRSDTVILNDLRFGQIAGWQNPEAPFVFHYYLNYPEANLLVVQRGRFSGWNRKTFSSLTRRIAGQRAD